MRVFLFGSCFMLVVLFILFDIGIGFEQRSFLWPSIDTVFAPGYNEDDFETIRIGMNEDEVNTLMCVPLFKHKEADGSVCYYYTLDGGCFWGDFAWMERSVVFKDNRVIGIRSWFCPD